MAAHRAEDKGEKRLLLLFLPLPLLPLSFLLLLFLGLSSLSFFLASHPLLGRLLLGSFANQEFSLLFFFPRFLVVYPDVHQKEHSRRKHQKQEPDHDNVGCAVAVNPAERFSPIFGILFKADKLSEAKIIKKNLPPTCPALYRSGARYLPRLCCRIPSYMELPRECQKN